MALETKIALPGSERHSVPGTLSGALDPHQVAQVTVVFKSKSDAQGPNRDLLEQFAHEHGLALSPVAHSTRSVTLQGPVQALGDAFSSQLAQYHQPETGITFRGRTGAVHVPVELASSIVAVLGLDTRPIAKPHNRRALAQQPAGSFTPLQVAQLYQFPAGDGAGQTIAIIELGGGYKTTDLNTYFKGLGLKTTPSVSAVAVGAGANQPGKDTNADGEVMLDIEVAGAVAPGAKIVVYFAKNTDQGFHDAIAQAANDTHNKPSVISISWGGPEDTWTQQARDAMNLAIQDAGTAGVTVTVASGDDGATDGVAAAGTTKLHVDFPASSPYALACGGTKLAGSGTHISSEVVWNELANNEGATGGGVSLSFPLPDYQKSAGVPVQGDTKFKGRGVPDVAGDADPVTGYTVRVDGKDMVIGGTSAVAPLWAGLIALVNQKLGKPVGFVNPVLYTLKSGFHDITSGNNNGYTAKTGWDPCTGLGSPNGAALLAALTAAHTKAPGKSPGEPKPVS
jgi:kumamolisin